ncbi:hypothetical protein JAAARDRAFT_205496 [Jaapia argillacea MUCL 33604]|uniref:Uncharacterized protein n=1 Tax=Jaapia argillacea MUCL 33604 TaxID=933084 RepID=A0A067Q7J6_9AGAM|nr:hypothetical protein JAAARDRAFT_205496 [Jaapia argillacea MUCL 33604]
MVSFSAIFEKKEKTGYAKVMKSQGNDRRSRDKYNNSDLARKLMAGEPIAKSRRVFSDSIMQLGHIHLKKRIEVTYCRPIATDLTEAPLLDKSIEGKRIAATAIATGCLHRSQLQRSSGVTRARSVSASIVPSSFSGPGNIFSFENALFAAAEEIPSPVPLDEETSSESIQFRSVRVHCPRLTTPKPGCTVFPSQAEVFDAEKDEATGTLGDQCGGTPSPRSPSPTDAYFLSHTSSLCDCPIPGKLQSLYRVGERNQNEYLVSTDGEDIQIPCQATRDYLRVNIPSTPFTIRSEWYQSHLEE